MHGHMDVKKQYVMPPLLTATKHKTTKYFQTTAISLQAVPFNVSRSQAAVPHRKPAMCRGHVKGTVRRSALFWIMKQRAVVIYYRRFGTTYRVPFSGFKNP